MSAEQPEHFHEGAEAPPRGVAVMAVLRWLLLAFVAGAAGVAWWSWARADPAAEHAPKYMCPMHPQITASEPGECPICHMALEPIADAAKAPAAAPLYRCPMHPQITAHEPGECPICHMSLEPVPEEQAPKDSPIYSCPMHPEQRADAPGRCPICNMDLVAAPREAPPGTAPLTLGLDRMQAIGVRTAEARERGFRPELRVAAVVEFAEAGAARVHARASGFIEKIAVEETGVRVHKGQRLAEYYSPEIYQAQTELIAARGWSGGQALTAARQRLVLLGVPDAVVDRVLKTGKPERTLPILAPAGGVVVARTAVLGAFVRPEEPLYELREDRVLYLVAEVPAARAAAVVAGLKGQAVFAGRPGRAEELAVDLVYPAAEPGSRAVRARMTLGNRAREHVAGELALVSFALPEVVGVAVPRDAVVDTGARPYVFVDRGGGHLEPRLVELGVRDDADVQVVAGVHAGERVVAGATFLVDSESRLRAAFAPAGP